MEIRKNNNEIYLGIDLGTTTTQMAVVDSTGTTKVLPNMDGDLVTPSIVSVAGKIPVAGKPAKQDKLLNPEMFAELFKRYMHLDPPPALVTSPAGLEYTPVTLSAELLYCIKESAEKLLGCKTTKAVVGVPAYFQEPARKATKQAALVAGFEQVHIVDEPTLAATFYGLAKGKNARIAVFDFGGGTFDISILDIKERGQIEPIAIDGDPECGGSNIDEAIFQLARKLVEEKGGQLSPHKDRAEWLEVLDACKEAKETLSRRDTAIIPLRIGNEWTSIQLTYEKLKELSFPIIDTLRKCCQKALKKADLKPSDIDKVLLVGGSTRLPFVAEIVRDSFGKDPVTDTDPDLAVARGAAITAAAYFGKHDEEILVDGRLYLASSIKPQAIAPRDLCVAAITRKEQGDTREYNVPIIPAGSKLLYEAIECFTPIQAQSNSVLVKLYDGHAGELSDDCEPLHQVEVKVQPTDEANNRDRIEFRIRMDAEGLVHIEVRDKLLNKPVPIKFKFHTGLSDSDIEKARSQLLARHSQAENHD